MQLDKCSDYRADHVAHLVLHRLVSVQGFVAVEVGLEIADVAVQSGACAIIEQAHPLQPVAQVAPVHFNAGHVAMHNHAVAPARQVFGAIPALLLDQLDLGQSLAVGAGGVGVAAVGTHQAGRSIISLSGLVDWYQ